MEFYAYLPAGDLNGTKEFLLKNQLSIGRSADNDIVILSNNVSRTHAVIYRDSQEIRIKDSGSNNGTLLNGRLVRDEIIKPDDIIQIADIEIAFRYGELSDNNTEQNKLSPEDLGVEGINTTSFIDLTELDVEKMQKIRDEKPSNTDHWQD